MRFPCLFLMTAAATLFGADTPDATAQAESKSEKLSEKDIAAIKDALGKLQSDEFEVRQKAGADLVAMGKIAVPLVTAEQKETHDSEVRERTKSILARIAETL